MRIFILAAAGLALILAWAGHLADADRVILTDGTVMQGNVSTGPGEVTVRTGNGILTLPAWRVARIEKGGQDVVPAGRAVPVPAPEQLRALGAALEAQVTADFDKMRLPDALLALAKQGGLTLHMSESVLRSEEVVDVHVRQVPLHKVLADLLEPRKLGVAVGQDGSLYVGRLGAPTAPRAADALSRTISVDFDNVSLSSALDYVREVTGLNMAVAPEVAQDTQPVRLRLTDVPVGAVLDIMLRPRGFFYTVQPGQIVFVQRAEAGRDYVMRIYDVRDLLVSTEDLSGRAQQMTGISRSGTRSGSQGTFLGSGGYSPQYGGTAYRSTLGAAQATAQAGYGGGYGFSPMTDRVANLILFIKGTCHPESWEYPASVGVIDMTGASGQAGVQY